MSMDTQRIIRYMQLLRSWCLIAVESVVLELNILQWICDFHYVITRRKVVYALCIFDCIGFSVS